MELCFQDQILFSDVVKCPELDSVGLGALFWKIGYNNNQVMESEWDFVYVEKFNRWTLLFSNYLKAIQVLLALLVF